MPGFKSCLHPGHDTCLVLDSHYLEVQKIPGGEQGREEGKRGLPIKGKAIRPATSVHGLHCIPQGHSENQ